MEALRWAVGFLVFLIGFIGSHGTRKIAKSGEKPIVSWAMLILFLYSFILPVVFPAIGIIEFHLIWVIPVIYAAAYLASTKNIPVLSRFFVWQAYLYLKLLLAGTGMTVSKLKYCSPWSGDSICREEPDFQMVGPIERIQSGKYVDTEVADELTQRGMKYEEEGNYTEAAKLYLKATDLGFPPAQAGLGSLYIRGEGVPKSYEEARKWYLKAADQGLTSPKYFIGLTYEWSGDFTRALEWYRKAAQENFALAQYKLGAMYECGLGVNQSHRIASYWFCKAGQQGVTHASIQKLAYSKGA